MSTAAAFPHSAVWVNATAMLPISLPPGMQLLPRGEDNVDITLYAENGQRGIILYSLTSGSIGVPLSHALEGVSKNILDASKPFNDESIQKHTLSINIDSYGIYNEQKYAYRTKGAARMSKTYAEVAKQVAEVVDKFFKTRVSCLAPDHNKLGLGGLGRQFNDLYLVALIPSAKHKRMYESVLGYYTTTDDDDLPHPWSSRYTNVFRIIPISLKQLLEYTGYPSQHGTLHKGKASRISVGKPSSRQSLRAGQVPKYEFASASPQQLLSGCPSITTASPSTEAYTESSNPPATSYYPRVSSFSHTPIMPDAASHTMQPTNNTFLPPAVHALQQSDEGIANVHHSQEGVYKSEPSAEEHCWADFHDPIPLYPAAAYDHTQYDTQAYRNRSYSPAPNQISPSPRRSTAELAYDYAPHLPAQGSAQWDDSGLYDPTYQDFTHTENSNSSVSTYSRSTSYDNDHATMFHEDTQPIDEQLYLDDEYSASSSNPACYNPVYTTNVSEPMAYTTAPRSDKWQPSYYLLQATQRYDMVH